MPIHDRACDRENVIGRPRPVLVFDLIEQGGDVAAPDGDELAGPPRRQNVAVEEPVDLPRGAQAVTLEMPRSPIGDYVAEGVSFRRRLDRGLAGLGTLDGLAGFLARFVDAYEIDGTNSNPHLFAGRIAGDGDVGFGP